MPHPDGSAQLNAAHDAASRDWRVFPLIPGDTPPAAWAEHGVTDGADVLAVLCERHGQPLPADTYTARTWSGGTHLYIAAPEGEPLRNTAGDSARGLGWKVDTRAWGGLVVGAGSTVAGRPYKVTNDASVAPLPGWLAELLCRRHCPRRHRSRWPSPAADGAPPSSSSSTLRSPWDSSLPEAS
ncbi:bifunctional DNA primase/polymerase [Streptomyces sp. NPDC126514]|uniref:bifunctional DNA primase/polymerase n=1 Tax=Streptomyces sp. NPDC126514 TaxID=3155210 RepID=UPI00332AE718